MFGIRLLLFVGLALIVFLLLGYSIKRDRRYLMLIGILVKSTLAILLVLGLLMLATRFLAL